LGFFTTAASLADLSLAKTEPLGAGRLQVKVTQLGGA
jgi:hypothetical protein